jgi:hypothetical protein
VGRFQESVFFGYRNVKMSLRFAIQIVQRYDKAIAEGTALCAIASLEQYSSDIDVRGWGISVLDKKCDML